MDVSTTQQQMPIDFDNGDDEKDFKAIENKQ